MGLTIPRTEYAQSGDVNIAYQVFGEGPIDLVFVAGFIFMSRRSGRTRS